MIDVVNPGSRGRVDPFRQDLLTRVGLDRTYVHGAGSWLMDDAGRRILDLTAQYGAVPLGHNAPAVWAAIEGVRRDGIPALVQPSRPLLAAQLAERLCGIAPLVGPVEGRVALFMQSGAEAVEVAIEQVRLATGRALVVGFERGYHGQTLAAGALSWTRSRSIADDRRPPGFAHLPWNDVAALEALFAARGDEVAAVVLEPIQGEGGIHEADATWLGRVRELCTRHGAKLVLDEVQTGLGRTGARFGVEPLGVLADVVLLSKALGGGLVPLAACVSAAGVHTEAFALRHGSTFANNNLTCAVGLAVLDALEDGLVLANVRRQGEALRVGLERIAARAPGVIRAVRGRGLLLGLELAPLVAERCFLLGHVDHEGGLVALAASYLLNAHGVRVIPALSGRTLRLEPCLTVTDDEVEHALLALEALVTTLHREDWAGLVRPMLRAREGRSGPDRALDLVARRAALAAIPDRRALARPVIASALPAEPRHGSRFAFLVHPTCPEDLVRTGPGLAGLAPDLLASLHAFSAERGGHAPVCAMPGVRGATGAFTSGELLTVGLAPAQLRAVPRKQLSAEVVKAARTAVARGAEVVGLGAFTSIVTRNGDDLHDLPCAVTTGNALTVALAIDGVAHAAARIGLDLQQARGLVVGLGAVGSAAAELLAERVGRLTVTGNPARVERDRRRANELFGRLYVQAHGQRAGVGEAAGVGAWLAEADRRWRDADARCRDLARRLERAAHGGPVEHEDLALCVAEAARVVGLEAPLRFAADRALALRQADVVIAATSDPEPVIGPDDLAPGALVCDVARPQDVEPCVPSARPDVLVFDGGLARLPDPISFGPNLALPPGVALACLTETLVLALDGVRTGRFGRLRELASEARAIRAAALRHGIGLGELRQDGRVLTAADLARVARARRATAMREVAA